MSFPSVAYEFTMNQLADSFMRNNPEISIRFIKINKAGAEDPYLERISSNDLPACGEIFWHAAYAKQNALYPLENLPDFQEIEEKVHQQAIYSTLNRENELHVHALYLYLSIPSFLILNPGLLEKAGITPPTIQPTWSSLQQMLQICDRKNRRNSTIHTTALNLPNSYHFVQSYLELMGQDLFSDSFPINSQEAFCQIFSTESALLGLELLQQIRDCGKILFHQGAEYFSLGNIAILPFSSSRTLFLLNMFDPELDYSIFAHPPIGKNSRYRSFYTGYSVGIFRKGIKSKAQLMATWKWLRFLFFRRSQYHLSQDLHFPMRKNMRSYLQEKRPATNALMLGLLSRAVPQPDFVGMRKMYTIVGEAIAAFLRKHTSPEQCLCSIRQRLETAVRTGK